MKSKWIGYAVAVCVVGSTPLLCAARKEKKVDVAVAEVPAQVRAAAEQRVPGLTLTEAERRSKKQVIFLLEGVADGKEYELRITAAGKILAVEEEGASRKSKKQAKNAPPYDGPAKLVGQIVHPAVRESSGIVASRTRAGVFWTHNDAGNSPALYAISREGRLLAEYPVFAPAEDWEDIATDDQGNLYLGNIGNNKLDRGHLEIYQLREPAVAVADASAPAALAVQKIWRLRFPEKPFNCESLLIHGDRGYVISKLSTGAPAAIYSFPLQGDASPVLEKVATLPINAPVTAADLSRDGKELVVLGAHLHLFTINGDLREAGSVRPRVIPLPARKLEGVCFDGGSLLLTAESREVYEYIPGAGE